MGILVCAVNVALFWWRGATGSNGNARRMKRNIKQTVKHKYSKHATRPHRSQCTTHGTVRVLPRYGPSAQDGAIRLNRLTVTHAPMSRLARSQHGARRRILLQTMNREPRSKGRRGTREQRIHAMIHACSGGCMATRSRTSSSIRDEGGISSGAARDESAAEDLPHVGDRGSLTLDRRVHLLELE